MRPATSHAHRMFALLAASVAVVLALARPALADTVRDQQWYLNALNIAQAHQITTGQGVTVGVVDSGVDASHPDLAGSVLPGTNTLTGSGNGQTDQKGHGTAMASLISGNADPDGVMGTAPEAKILPVRSGKAGSKPTNIAQGIRWAVDHGATVINVSIAGGGGGPNMRKAVAYAQRHDVVVVAGTGNTPGTKVGYPAAFPGVIAVSCVGKDGKSSSKYTTGEKVELAAPCTDAVAAQPGGGYSTAGGTSNSTALVSGIAALIRAKYPNANAATVVNRLIKTADDRGASGHNPKYGHGVVNPVKALTADVPKVTKNPLGRVKVDDKPGGLAERPEQTPEAAGSDDGDGGSGALGIIIALIVAIVVIVAAAVLVLVLVLRRGGRNRQPPTPAGPPPGYGPPGPGGPPGAPGPPGHRPPPGYGDTPPQAPPPGGYPQGPPPPPRR